MVIDVVDNRGIASMASELAQCFDSFNTVRLATASLTKEGLAELEHTLSSRRKSLKVKLLVGLYNGHTESAALRKLLSLQKSVPGVLEVKIARNDRFHWKVYIFGGKQRVVAYVGSSNLTRDGLGAEGEFNVRLSGTRKEHSLRDIVETFDRAWSKDSAPLDREISESFAPLAKRSRKSEGTIDPKIRRLLRRVPRPPANGTYKRKGDGSCFTFVDGFTAAKTEFEVQQKTTWESNGWDWMACHNKSERDRLLKAGSFFLAEVYRNGGTISFNDVRDDDEFRTEDGRFFIAFQTRRDSITKTLNARTLRLLKRGGLISRKDDLLRDRTLGAQKRLFLSRLLRVKT